MQAASIYAATTLNVPANGTTQFGWVEAAPFDVVVKRPMGRTRGVLIGCAMLLALTAEPCAAGGWYLLSPPLAYKKGATDDDPRAWVLIRDAPFSKWYREGAFDTAKECMAERDAQNLRAHQIFRSKLSAPTSLRDSAFDLVTIQASEIAECVASDDQRLLR